MHRRTLLAAAAALAATPASAEADTVRISHGLGVLYLPLIIMREARLLEAELARANIRAAVQWAVLDGAGPINDALIAGALDIAGNSIPGFLTIWSRARGGRSEVVGVSGLSTAAMILNTNRPDIRTLADFKPGDKIAVPSARVSIQAVVLQMAVAKQFGDAEFARLDTNTVSLSHPTAVTALLSGNKDLAAHFASPPFTVAEAASPNVHAVLRSPDVLGDITLDMVFAAKRFTTANPGHVRAFLAAQRAANFIVKDDPSKAIQLFIQNSGSKIDPIALEAVLAEPDTRFDTAPHGFMRYAEFMHRAGTIKVMPKDWREAFVPELEDAGS